jgi:hypothetical protein
MTNFLVALILASPFSSASVPRQYKVATKLYLNGTLFSSPTLVVNEGKLASVSDTDLDGTGRFVDVLAERGPKDNQVHLSLAFGKIVAGKRTEIVRPEFLALEGEETSMEVSDSDQAGRPVSQVRASVVATREN